MIELSRKQIQCIRSTMRQALGRRVPVMTIQAISDALLIRATNDFVAIECRLTGSDQPACFAIPFDALAAREGRQDDTVRFEQATDMVTLRWFDADIPQSAQFSTSEPISMPELPSAFMAIDRQFLDAMADERTYGDEITNQGDQDDLGSPATGPRAAIGKIRRLRRRGPRHPTGVAVNRRPEIPTRGDGRKPMIAPAVGANTVVQSPPQRDYISFSAISTYQQCPLKYFFKYIEGLEDKFATTSLALGGAIHSAAEFHFNELLAGSPPPDHDTLRGVFWEEWQSRCNAASIRFGKGEDLDSVEKTADRVIAAFRDSEFARPTGTILGIEEELRLPLIPGLPDILGRIDLIVDTDDALKIIDLKTARSRWSTDQAERAGEQLMLYAALAKDLVPGKPMQLEFAVITKTANPTVECFPVSLREFRIERTKRVMESVWSAVQSRHFYPAPSPMTCPSCSFRNECDAWIG
ncbi:MAG: hypothetical protein JWP89_402 [Schlesneria sp.]|nr:hypothetical protein [Schlesneria sp.]